MLSQAHLDSIIDSFPLMELNKGLYTSHSKPKEKQIKKPFNLLNINLNSLKFFQSKKFSHTGKIN